MAPAVTDRFLSEVVPPTAPVNVTPPEPAPIVKDCVLAAVPSTVLEKVTLLLPRVTSLSKRVAP